jgi:hypothetical protein
MLGENCSNDQCSGYYNTELRLIEALHAELIACGVPMSPLDINAAADGIDAEAVIDTCSQHPNRLMDMYMLMRSLSVDVDECVTRNRIAYRFNENE